MLLGIGTGTGPAGVGTRFKQIERSPWHATGKPYTFTVDVPGIKNGSSKCVPEASGTSQECCPRINDIGFPILNLYLRPPPLHLQRH